MREKEKKHLPDANLANPSVCMYTRNGLMDVTSTYSLRSNLLPSISNGRSMYLLDQRKSVTRTDPKTRTVDSLLNN